ncbi:hypothetical protein JIQ42_00843 [Leishmania sp. Namibia]|uniref:hypothetical protein n=1 Tax=Leishmania sp. Namibia TaxID=2802991 RepID=UPI001B65E0D8|nr:hypothetical protein JIQ42_00843 [Leishmania sp. Namibia]
MSDAIRSSGEPAEPARSHKTPVIRIRVNGGTSHTVGSFKSEQTPLLMATPQSETPDVASPLPPAYSGTADSPTAAAAVLLNPPSSPCVAMNPMSSHDPSLSCTACSPVPLASPVLLGAQGAGSPATAPATKAATVEPRTVLDKDGSRAVPVAWRSHLSPTDATAVRDDLSAAAVASPGGISSVASGYLATASPSSDCSHESIPPPNLPLPARLPASVTAIPLGAEDLTRVAAGTQDAANELPLGSAPRQQAPAHHGNHFVLQGPRGPAGGLVGAQVYSCSSALDREPRILSQGGPAAVSMSTEHDAGCTPCSASRKRAVDASATGSSDAMSSFHSTANLGTRSPDISRLRTQMHLEPHEFGNDAFSPEPHTINFSDSGVNANSVKGTPAVPDGIISSDFSAPSRRARWASASVPRVAGGEENCKMVGAYTRSGSADPHQSSSTSFNRTSSAAGAAVDPTTTTNQAKSISTSAAAVDDLKKSPSLLERNGNLEDAFGAPVSTAHTTLSTADTAAGEVGPVSPQEPYGTLESQQMEQALPPALGPSLSDSSGVGTQPSATLGLSGCGGTAAVPTSLSTSPAEVTSFTPPPPTAGRDEGEAEGEGKSCEGPAQTDDTRTEVRSEMQCSSNRSVLYQCNSAALSPPRLQHIDSENRNTLESPTDHLDGGRASGGAPIVSSRSHTACLKSVADGYVSFRSSNSSLLPSPATSCVDQSETDYRQVSATATEHDARVSSGHAGRLAARSGGHLSPATGTPPYSSRQPDVLAAEVLRSKAPTAPRLPSASSPGTWAVQPPVSTAPRQDPGPRSHSRPQSPGYSASGSDDENGKSVRGAAAATHPPSAAAAVNAVGREWGTDSSSTPTRTCRGPNEEGKGEDASGAAMALAPASESSAALPFQPIRDMNYDKASGLVMEQCCLNPILLNVASGRLTVTTVSSPGGGSDAGSRNGNGSDALCSSPPFSVERQACVGVVPSNAATCPPLSRFEAQGDVGARAGRASHPDTVTASAESTGSTSTRVFVKGSLTNSGVTTVANRSWSTAGGADPAPRRLGRSLSVDSPAALAKQRAGGVVVDDAVAEDDAMWGEPTSSALIPAPKPPAKAAVHVLARHVTFADPVTTDFVEPPQSPWADREYFLPNYAYVEYKGSEKGGPSEQEQLADVPLVDGEEDEVMRSVPRFRFRHRSAHAQSSSSLPGVEVQPRGLAWEAWSHGSDSVRSRTSSANSGEDAPTASRATHTQQQAKAAALPPSQGGGEEGKAECAVAERPKRVFFTKERLASRAAQMQSRRAGVQAAGSTNAVTAAAASRWLPEPGAFSAPLLPPPPPPTASIGDGGPTYPTRLPSSSTDAAKTISLALPDFASPFRSASTSTQQGSNMVQASPSPSSDRDIHTTKSADNVDDFGGWIQQQHATSPGPLPGAAGSTTASQPLTRERCAQLLASLDGGSVPVPQSVAPPAVDTERVVDVLRDVFGDIAAASDSLHGESLLPDAPPELILVNDASPPNLLTPSKSLSTMGRVLEALSFTSLTSRASDVSLACHDPTLPYVSFDPSSGGQCFGASAAVAAAVLSDGYVVPWPTHAAAAGAAPLKVASASTDGKGLVRSVDSSVACASAEVAIPQEADVEDGEDASVHLTRQRLFPSNAHSACPHGTVTATLSVASFLGSRRLPDAPAAAQWTESDVVLAVLQEQRRMARENDAVAEAERLENVLRTAYS